MPKISIIIPVYNQAKALKECLASIFNQTRRDFEVIVVDDGSKEDVAGAIGESVDKVKLICQKNRGAAAARNAGFRESSGEFLLFCDADIILKPSALAKMLETMENNKKIAFVYSSFYFGWKKFKLWPFDLEKLKQMPYVHSTSLIRREFFPGWDENLKKFQDWDLFLTIGERGGQGVWINETLFKVKAGGTISSWLPSFFYKLPINNKAKEKYLAGREIIFKKHNLN